MLLPKVNILRKIHYKVHPLEVKHIAYVRIYIEEMDSQFDVSGIAGSVCQQHVA